MQTYILKKGLVPKLFMLIAFLFFSLVMYQGYISKGGIYTVLFFISIALISFQIVSIFYVIFVKRTIILEIDDKKISWKIYDNKKLYKKEVINLDQIDEIRTEISYFIGNIYSNFNVTFILNSKHIVLTDGLLYDFGLKKAEEVCKFLLENNLGHKQDVKFFSLIKKLNIDLSKEQIFSKKHSNFYYIGVISKNKKEFLSLRLQLEALYKEYKIVEKNANNEYLIKSNNKKDSFIYLRSNVIGYFIEFYKVDKKKELKTLEQMGKRDKIGF